jgi:chemotaxis protein MotB
MALMAVATMSWGTGCVSLDQYRQLEMDHRTLLAEKKQVEQDLQDCRDGEDNLRTRLTSVESELETQRQLALNLQQENDRLAMRAEQLTGIAEKIAGGQTMHDPLIIERRLPPALDTALREFASRYSEFVSYDAKRGTVKWASDPLFALGSVVVRQSAKESLAKFADVFNSAAAEGFDALIVGHTDNLPIRRSETMKMHPTNWHLSAHRAIAVSSVLQKSGVRPERIGVMGFGEFRPVKPNTTDKNRAQNRRVEVFIVRHEDMYARAATMASDAALAAADK